MCHSCNLLGLTQNRDFPQNTLSQSSGVKNGVLTLPTWQGVRKKRNVFHSGGPKPFSRRDSPLYVHGDMVMVGILLKENLTPLH